MYRKRLDMITEHVKGTVVADIGTDHAYVPIKLIEKNICEKVIATDVNAGPLKSAESNVNKHNMEKYIELRLGSGLLPLSAGECNCIIIAGMGGELVCNILSEGEYVARNAGLLILQPMNAQDMLRKFLNENGYKIIDEDITVEGFKVYNLILAQYGGEYINIDEFSLHLPGYLFEKDCFPALLAKKKREFTKILKGLLSSSVEDDIKISKYQDFLRKIEYIEKTKISGEE